MKQRPQDCDQVHPWRVPGGLVLATLAGLLLALTGGVQPWRALAWALLALPILVGAGALLFQLVRKRS